MSGDCLGRSFSRLIYNVSSGALNLIVTNCGFSMYYVKSSFAKYAVVEIIELPLHGFHANCVW